MNADLKGMWNYYFKNGRCPKCHHIILTDKGKHLTHTESRMLVEWGLKNGYTHLQEMPEFEDINFNE